MDGLGSADILQFECFRLDRRAGCLCRLDQTGIAAQIALGSRTLDLLALLVSRGGELVSKDLVDSTAQFLDWFKKPMPNWGIFECCPCRILKLEHIGDGVRLRLVWARCGRFCRRYAEPAHPSAVTSVS